MILDHVAIVTTDLERFCALNQLSSSEPIEAFEDTGSRERYMDGDASGARLLLFHPQGSGPYQRALTKRGPGLHHLGFAVADMAAALDAWRARGWQQHPDNGAFLFQRGVPTLIELFTGMLDLGAPATSVALAAAPEQLLDLAGVSCGAQTTTVTHRGRVLQLI